MNPVNERIRELVEKSGASKTDWAKKLNISPQYMSSLCLGKNPPSDRTIMDICREYHVNEAWLRTGEGDVYSSRAGGVLQELAEKYHLSDSTIVLVEKFISLKPEIQDAIVDCAVEAAFAIAKLPSESDETTEEKLERLERENAELRRQLAAARVKPELTKEQLKALVDEHWDEKKGQVEESTA